MKISLRRPHGYARSAAMPTDDATTKSHAPQADANGPGKKRPLPAAAERALAEAAARRAGHDRDCITAPKEAGGRCGPDPTRYGDWEINGIASDF
jgi:hypothetical protein